MLVFWTVVEHHKACLVTSAFFALDAVEGEAGWVDVAA
jgi:hypothetical protein